MIMKVYCKNDSRDDDAGDADEAEEVQEEVQMTLVQK